MKHAWTSTWGACLLIALGMLELSAMRPAAARAATCSGSACYSSEKSLEPFIWYTVNLVNGHNYTFETRNLTAGGDTVMHLLRYLGGNSYARIAANDDAPGTLASAIQWRATVTGEYRIWVHSYLPGSAGRADLYINGSPVLTQNRFGGETDSMPWSSGQEFRVTGTQRGKTNSTMLFLSESVTQFLQMDRNSGPKNYSYLLASGSYSGASRVVWGAYPNTSCRGTLTKQDLQISGSSCSDADGDCISASLEGLIGTSPSNADSDNDAIPDELELWGNEGWSYSEGSVVPNNNPRVRNVYVQADYMVGGLNQNETPYANLEADVATIFSTDGPNIRVDVVRSASGIGFIQMLAYNGNCPGQTCTDFYQVKSNNFGPGDRLVQKYFHYAVFAAQVFDGSMNNCATGQAEILGNDVIVSLDQPICGYPNGNIANQRGTFVHELGHNFGFTHNGNGNNPPPAGPTGRGPNSTVHLSVMNYNYQLPGVPATPGRPAGSVLTYTYAGGLGGCAACATSPKLACININMVGGCAADDALQVGRCDCDVFEWGTLNADFYEGQQQEWGDGMALFAFEDPAARQRRARNAPVEDELLPDTRAVPEEPAAHRRARVSARADALRARGEREGQDFRITADGLHLYTTCK